MWFFCRIQTRGLGLQGPSVFTCRSEKSRVCGERRRTTDRETDSPPGLRLPFPTYTDTKSRREDREDPHPVSRTGTPRGSGSSPGRSRPRVPTLFSPGILIPTVPPKVCLTTTPNRVVKSVVDGHASEPLSDHKVLTHFNSVRHLRTSFSIPAPTSLVDGPDSSVLGT